MPDKMTKPNTSTDNAIAISVNGNDSPAAPNMPPSAMTATNVVGTAHNARPPS